MTTISKRSQAGPKTTTSPASKPHPSRPAAPSERLMKDIRRQTKPIFSSEQKVLVIMEGIRGELSIAELCRKYAISTQTYYTWNKEFIEAGKKRLSGDGAREATSSGVAELRTENSKLKESLADLVLRYDIVKKSLKLLE